MHQLLRPSSCGLQQRHRCRAAASADERLALNTFTAWAIERKVQFGGLRPDVKDSSRGLYATHPIEPGRPLVAVPRSSCLTLSANEPAPAPLRQHAQLWQRLPWWARLAVKLCLLERADPSLQPYVAILPTRVDLPALWWADGTGQQQQQHGGLEEGGSATCADYPVHELQLPYMVAKVREEQRHWRLLEAQLGPLLAPLGVPQARLLWALAVVRSRSFEAPTFKVPTSIKVGLAAVLPLLVLVAETAWDPARLLDAETLAAAAAALGVPAALTSWDLKNSGKEMTYAIPPFLDLLNHSSNAQAEVGYDWVRDVFYVSSGAYYVSSSQVLISYGELSNDALLQLYGFVESGNEHDRYIMLDLGRWLTHSSALRHAAAGSVPPAGTSLTCSSPLPPSISADTQQQQCLASSSTTVNTVSSSCSFSTAADAQQRQQRLANGVALVGAASAGEPQLPAWKAQQLEAALRQACQGGLLTEVEVRRSGFPPDVLQACLDLSRTALRLRHQDSLDAQQACAAWQPGEGSVVALAAQALSEACADELQALGTSVEHDELELKHTQRMAALAAQPAPAPPTPPTPPTEPHIQPDPDTLYTAAGASGEQSRCQQLPLLEQVSHGSVLTTATSVAALPGTSVLTSVAVIQPLDAQTTGAPLSEAALRYHEQLQRYEQELRRHELLSQQHGLKVAEWQEARAAGPLWLGRLALAIQYRLEKKRVLVAGMGAVVEWMRTRMAAL